MVEIAFHFSSVFNVYVMISIMKIQWDLLSSVIYLHKFVSISVACCLLKWTLAFFSFKMSHLCVWGLIFVKSSSQNYIFKLKMPHNINFVSSDFPDDYNYCILLWVFVIIVETTAICVDMYNQCWYMYTHSLPKICVHTSGK